MRLLIILILTSFAFSAYAFDTYKWTDERGITKYSQTLTPEIISQGYTIYRNNRPAEVIPPAKTQLETEAEKQARLKQQARSERMNILKQLYSSEDDIVRQRDDKVDSIEKAIQIAKENNQKSQFRIEELMTYSKKLTGQGKKVPPSATQEMTELWQQIEANEQYVKNQEKEKQDIIKKYGQDLKDFRSLQRAIQNY